MEDFSYFRTLAVLLVLGICMEDFSYFRMLAVLLVLGICMEEDLVTLECQQSYSF